MRVWCQQASKHAMLLALPAHAHGAACVYVRASVILYACVRQGDGCPCSKVDNGALHGAARWLVGIVTPATKATVGRPTSRTDMKTGPKVHETAQDKHQSWAGIDTNSPAVKKRTDRTAEPRRRRTAAALVAGRRHKNSSCSSGFEHRWGCSTRCRVAQDLITVEDDQDGGNCHGQSPAQARRELEDAGVRGVDETSDDLKKFVVVAVASCASRRGKEGLGRCLLACRRKRHDGILRAEKYNLLHEGFPKLGAPLTVVMRCFGQGIDANI
jgi:hypothetical protein